MPLLLIMFYLQFSTREFVHKLISKNKNIKIEVENCAIMTSHDSDLPSASALF